MNKFKVRQIVFLAKHSIKKKYTNSVLGILWAIILPLIQSFTFYIFFVEGMRFTGTIQGHPLIVFLITGNLAWVICAAILTSGPGFISMHTDLIKNVSFSFITVIFIEVIAMVLIHCIVVAVVSLLLINLGYGYDISYINFLYFWFIFIVYASALAYILSLITLLVRDIKFLISSLMVPLFWMSPVLWVPSGLIETAQKILNPIYYFIYGYRYTILENEFLWEHWKYNLYFLFLTFLMISLAFWMHKKLNKKIYDLI